VSDATTAGGEAAVARYHVTEAALRQLVDAALAAGQEVVAPVVEDACASPGAAAALAACRRPDAAAAPGGLAYRAVGSAAEVHLGGGLPALSLKDFFLPRQEPLLRFRQRGSEVTVEEPEVPGRPRLVVAATPCDAAALAIVDRVMNWDYEDEPWNRRRAATTVVGLACAVVDESCFCTAVGGAPDDTRGLDALLTPVEDGFVLEVVTEKGATLAATHEGLLTALEEGDGRVVAAARARAEARARAAATLDLDPAAVRDWVAANYDHPLLLSLGDRCNGCGACTGVCPTCHCFDIADEEEGVGRGTRRRFWDTCQSRLFTLHASGHDPRPDQHRRYRQRVAHKFSIYPLRFGEVLCTGCGRCTRVCHAGQDLVEILRHLDAAARGDAQGGSR